jgi:hypothetical protein
MPTTPIAVVCAAELAKARNHHPACSPIDGTKYLNTSARIWSWNWLNTGNTDSVPRAITASGTSETSAA